VNLPPAPPRRVAILGGGISGLAAAHRLLELDENIDLTLFEASSRLGGVLKTERREEFLLDRGPDNFLTQLPWATNLCERLGLADQLLPTNDTHRRAFVVRKGALHEIPEGFVLMAPSKIWPVLTTPILSLRGKLRLGWEFFVPKKKEDEDESFASFVTRRLGRETYERIVQPLISSIYVADASKLSIRATMPQFVAMERDHGSLIRGASRRAAARKAENSNTSGARYGMFTAPRDGMESIVHAIVAKLPPKSIRLDSPVTQVAPTTAPAGKWEITLANGSAPEVFDAVICAVPAPRASEILAEVDTEIASTLGEIVCASSAVIFAAYERSQIARPLNGFGFVVPAIENRKSIAGSFSSVKYAGRALPGFELMRLFVGGACHPELVDWSDYRLKNLALDEFADLLGIRGEPALSVVTRWREAMPQYHVGHVERVAKIEDRVATIPGFELAGNAYHGIGVPQCIHTGEQAAERILEKA